jgi:phosphonate transport system permease protein
VGIGPLAGIIAIPFKTVGFFSKLLAEDLEDIDMGSMEAVEATGGSKFQSIVYGVVPQILPAFVGVSVYRWDINVRGATILGFVGAGGIGVQLFNSIDAFQWRAVATIIAAILLIVLLSEAVSAYAREKVR